MTDFSTIWKEAKRKARYNGLTFYVADYGHSADTIVFDGGRRGDSQREATTEEVAMWPVLPSPPEDWEP